MRSAGREAMTTRRARRTASVCGRWLAVVLASAIGVAAPPDASVAREYDWCAPVVVRPDVRRARDGACEPPRWSDEEIADGAEVVLLGDADDVSESRIERPVSKCEWPGTHRDNGTYVARLRALRKARAGGPLRVVHLTRFDLVSDTLAAQPGFQADYLLRTDRPWKQVLDYFAADRSPQCLDGGCRWSHAYGGVERRGEGTWLRDFIDASGGPSSAESAIYYVVRASQVKLQYWPLAALADLGNAQYRKWRVAEAKRAVELGGYDAVNLNHKFYQYKERDGFWLGNDEAPDATTLRRLGRSIWTAPPRGYGYPEYVRGWAALGTDLRAAGVPYSVSLPAAPFLDRADDPGTREVDEARLIRETARGARIAILERRAGGSDASLETFRAELGKAGVHVVLIDTRCGKKKK